MVRSVVVLFSCSVILFQTCGIKDVRLKNWLEHVLFCVFIYLFFFLIIIERK